MTIVPAYMRTRGEISADFAAVGRRTQVARVFETGGYRLRYPRSTHFCEAVLVNTGGGVAGGDQVGLTFSTSPGAQVTLTTPSAERIYRADAEAAEITLSLNLADGADLEWLPQETILFNGARLHRRVDVDMESSAQLTLTESVIFGRMASGELTIDGSFRDRWRVRRDRRLIFAEENRLEGDVTGLLDRPAIGRQARATALILHVAPDAETKLDALRAAVVDGRSEWGASARDGMLVVRLLSPSPECLRADILTALSILRGRDAPRIWQA
jgi:urease accessory protein